MANGGDIERGGGSRATKGPHLFETYEENLERLSHDIGYLAVYLHGEYGTLSSLMTNRAVSIAQQGLLERLGKAAAEISRIDKGIRKETPPSSTQIASVLAEAAAAIAEDQATRSLLFPDAPSAQIDAHTEEALGKTEHWIKYFSPRNIPASSSQQVEEPEEAAGNSVTDEERQLAAAVETHDASFYATSDRLQELLDRAERIKNGENVDDLLGPDEEPLLIPPDKERLLLIALRRQFEGYKERRLDLARLRGEDIKPILAGLLDSYGMEELKYHARKADILGLSLFGELNEQLQRKNGNLGKISTVLILVLAAVASQIPGARYQVWIAQISHELGYTDSESEAGEFYNPSADPNHPASYPGAGMTLEEVEAERVAQLDRQRELQPHSWREAEPLPEITYAERRPTPGATSAEGADTETPISVEPGDELTTDDLQAAELDRLRGLTPEGGDDYTGIGGGPGVPPDDATSTFGYGPDEARPNTP